MDVIHTSLFLWMKTGIGLKDSLDGKPFRKVYGNDLCSCTLIFKKVLLYYGNVFITQTFQYMKMQVKKKGCFSHVGQGELTRRRIDPHIGIMVKTSKPI
jgi:hypothetical protein